MKLIVITVRGKKALGTVLADPDGLGLFSGGSADSVGMQEHIDADNAGDSKKAHRNNQLQKKERGTGAVGDGAVFTFTRSIDHLNGLQFICFFDHEAL